MCLKLLAGHLPSMTGVYRHPDWATAAGPMSLSHPSAPKEHQGASLAAGCNPAQFGRPTATGPLPASARRRKGDGPPQTPTILEDYKTGKEGVISVVVVPLVYLGCFPLLVEERTA